ncbi:hypothetical protein M758_N007700, partial [Ceratodon purpureus]
MELRIAFVKPLTTPGKKNASASALPTCKRITRSVDKVFSRSLPLPTAPTAASLSAIWRCKDRRRPIAGPMSSDCRNPNGHGSGV